MKYPIAERILSENEKYTLTLDQTRTYEGDDDLPKVFPGEGNIVAMGQTFQDFEQNLTRYLQESGLGVEDVYEEDDGKTVLLLTNTGTDEECFLSTSLTDEEIAKLRTLDFGS